jgi:hypothetical protein
MKKLLSLLTCTLLALVAFAQETPQKKTIDLSNRANDHLLIQLGSTHWSGIPDSITTKGLSKSFNLYVMFDFPFKTNPKLSMAFGPGIASDHIIFSKTFVAIKENAAAIHFINQSDTTHFKKTKLATAYLEAPIEFRYSARPEGTGFKFAIGVKIGTMLTAHTRNSKLEDKSDNLINDYVMKESSKRFFNKNRMSGMVRIGYGHISLYGSYQFSQLFKDGAGPVVKPFSIGLTLSGL